MEHSFIINYYLNSIIIDSLIIIMGIMLIGYVNLLRRNYSRGFFNIMSMDLYVGAFYSIIINLIMILELLYKVKANFIIALKVIIIIFLNILGI